MSSNKFEKQVQKNLEELQFTPSEAVWQNVEKELRKEKKRRRWLLLPLLSLLIAVGGYFVYNNSNNTTSSIEKNTPVSVPAVPSVKEETTIAHKGETAATDKQYHNTVSDKDKNDDKFTEKQTALNGSPLNGTKPVGPISNSKANQAISTVNYNNKQNISATFADKKSKNISKKIKWVNSDQVASILPSDKNKKIIEKETKADIGIEEVHKTVIANKNKADENASVTNDVTPPLEKETVVKGADILTNLHDVVTKKDSTQPKDKIDTVTANVPVVTKPGKQENKKNKWKWYGDVAVGVSNLNTSFAPFGALGISQENKSADALPFVASRTPVQNTQPAPSASKPGFSFKAGVTAERKISKRSSISIGLQYAYYSNFGVAGEIPAYVTFNSGVSNFNSSDNAGLVYLSGPASRNRNEYHFLQMPVSFSTRIGNSRRLPWYWNTGVSINYLFASNALVYNNAEKQYIKNKNLFQYLQLGWHTGIEAEFFTKKKHPLRLGPQFNFNLSHLLRNSGGQNQRFTYVGIKASMLLNKK